MNKKSKYFGNWENLIKVKIYYGVNDQKETQLVRIRMALKIFATLESTKKGKTPLGNPKIKWKDLVKEYVEKVKSRGKLEGNISRKRKLETNMLFGHKR